MNAFVQDIALRGVLISATIAATFSFFLCPTKALGAVGRTNSASYRPHQNQTVAPKTASSETLVATSPQVLFRRAEAIRRCGTAICLRESISLFRTAASAARSTHDEELGAKAQNEIGEISFELGNLAIAMAAHRSALALSRLAKDQVGEARALNGMSTSLIYGGHASDAISLAEAALRLSLEASDGIQRAAAYKNLGEAYHSLTSDAAAVTYLTKALAVSRESGDASGEAYAEYAIGYVRDDMGQMQEAKDREQRALSLWKGLDDARGEALAFKEIGAIAMSDGELQNALDAEHQAMTLFVSCGDRLGEASTDMFLGAIMEQLGEPMIAIDFHRRALRFYREAPSKLGEALALAELGHTFNTMGRNREARLYSAQWLELSFNLQDLRQESLALDQLGLVETSAGRRQTATMLYRRALLISQKAADVRAQAETLLQLGSSATQSRDFQTAFTYVAEVSRLSEKLDDPRVKAMALYQLGRIYLAQSDLTDARSCLEAAIGIIESERIELESRDERATFFASLHDLYSLYIDVLMRLYRRSPTPELLALSLEVSEQERARSLLDIVSDHRNHNPVDPNLLAKEQSLRELLNSKAQEQLRFQTTGGASNTTRSLAEEVRSAAFEYREVIGAIDFEREGAAPETTVLSATQMENEIDSSTVVLEYSLGDSQSYLWLISSDSLEAYEIPSRYEIEKAIREIRPFLTSPHLAESYATHAYQKRAQLLSDMLLGPVADAIKGKRLIVAADGGLDYLPFAALPLPRQGGGGTQEVLIDDHEIIMTPSVSVLAALRTRRAVEMRPKKLMIIFADPVFDASDPRVRHAAAQDNQITSSSAHTRLTRAFSYKPEWSRHGIIPRLPATRDEAEGIRGLIPNSEVDLTLDFDANRGAVLTGELGDYAIIHFATHAVVDTDTPELSGVVLSLVDQYGHEEDGFLRLDDVSNLKLRSDLVVLSACNTNLGRDLKGEGIVGLSQGFLRAGAGSVLSTLWTVDDDASAVLVKRFYFELLVGKKSSAMALRSAQSWMSQQARWSTPYYWAGFVLQGDWK